MSKIFALVFVLIAVCGLTARAQVLCGPYDVRGTYAVSYQGDVYHYTAEGTLDPVPLPDVLLGTASVTPVKPFHGALSGQGTVSVGPRTMKVKFEGTVELRPDCTATATYTLQPEGAPAPSPVPAVEEWVVLKRSNQIKVIITQFPFGRHVTLGSWERIGIGE